MLIDLNSKSALISAARAASMPIAFLLGSPLSKDSGGGVPGTDLMLDFIRDEIRLKASSELSRFEGDMKGRVGADAYQAAMKWLQANLTHEAVNRVIAKAVLQARKHGVSDIFTYDGIADDWHLPQGIRQVAELVTHMHERFPGPILTTNFDPLLSLAIEAAGGRANLRVIDSDGSVGRSVEHRPGVTDVIHLHGYWRDSDTLHTLVQLTGARPKLQASLKRLLSQRTLIVAAYGGWDDVFTRALAELLNDDDAMLNVLWCFYESDQIMVEARYRRLLESVTPGITRGRFLAYGGIDCHSIFGEIGDVPTSAVVTSPTDLSPIVGWEQIDANYLSSLTPLRAKEVIRYFDGAVPTWRHAVSDFIPCRSRKAASKLNKWFGDLYSASDDCSLLLIRAAGGEGKTTLLLQAAANAARSGNWVVLWRPSPNIGLPSGPLMSLDSAKQWLLVVDDAENLIPDLKESARRLHDAGRTNIHFLLAARDTDWRFARGDKPPWPSWLKRQNDIVLRGIEREDAVAVVDAWRNFGADGLRELAKFAAPSEQVSALEDAVKDAAQLRFDGSFFGGLLDIRFGPDGLRAHVRDLLNHLKEEPVQGGSNLFDALLYVAACHGVNIPGINASVLADLISVPRDWVYSRVVRPLGQETVAVQSAGHVFTRHSKVAAAILVEAEHSLEVDLAEVWTNLIRQTVRSTRNLLVGHQTYQKIVHAGPGLQNALPKQLSIDRRRAIAIAAAQAFVAAEPDRLSAITDLGRTYRNAKMFPQAVATFRERLGEAVRMVDYSANIRGYWYEWSVCEGGLGKEREHAIANASLGGVSLSDYLNPTPITDERGKLSCAGLGIAFSKLAEARPDCPYAKARRATSYLGRLTLTHPDSKAMDYYDRADLKADKINTPHPKDIAEAIEWLTAGVTQASRELRDPFLSTLAEPAQVSFRYFQAVLTTASAHETQEQIAIESS